MRFFAAVLAALVIFQARPAGAEYNGQDRAPVAAPARVQRSGPVEPWPRWMIGIADPLAEPIGRTAAHVVWRKGRIARHPDAIARIERTLRPLDIVLIKSTGRLTGRLIPGRFSHAIVYLGRQRDLEGLGVWEAEPVRRHQAAIRAGMTFIEAESEGVHLSPIGKVADADQLVVLRPSLGRDGKRRATRDFFAHLGERYDFHMDAGESEALYCSELVDHVLASGFPRRVLYGRQVIMPGEVAGAALAGRAGLSVKLYIRTRNGGWEVADRAALRKDVDEGW